MASTDGGSSSTPPPDVPPPAMEVLIERCDWRPYESLPVFSIRNGDPSDVQSLLIKPTIPKAYHWPEMASLSSTNALKALDGYILSANAQLASNLPSGMTPELRRKVAIVLGVVRAVSTMAYSLGEGDFIPGETAPAYLAVTTNDTGEISYRTAPGVVPNPELTTKLVLSETEQAAVSCLMPCALGVLPMQGYSLIMTGHHYLSDAGSQARKVYAVVEKAYLKGSVVGDWFTSDMQAITDALWHKSGHPVQVSLKSQLAMNPVVAADLKMAGAGACASRLPAIESELRATNSYITLLSTVSPMLGMYGGELNYDYLITVSETVTSFPIGVLNCPKPQNAPPDMPDSVTNRVTALAWLSNVLKRNADAVAYCYGFYCALSENSQVLGASGATDTLKVSNSLTKLKTQSYASYVSGSQAYGDYQAARNAMRSAGKFNAPKFTLV